MKRFAAKLLFQYRVVVDGVSSKMRTVEERIVTVTSREARNALAAIKKRAYRDQITYTNNDGNEVFIEFVGVMDFIELGIECSKNDVWYEIKTMREPMERKGQLIPEECDLPAIKLSRKPPDRRKTAKALACLEKSEAKPRNAKEKLKS